jgi:hypothetical protein
MSEQDQFDLTQGGDEDERSASVPSLRRRGRPAPPPGARAQNRPHREFAARVQVPRSASAPQPAAHRAGPAPLEWNHRDGDLGPTARAVRLPLSVLVVIAVLAVVGWVVIHGDHATAARTAATTTPLISADPFTGAARTFVADIDALNARITPHAQEAAKKARTPAAVSKRTPPVVASTQSSSYRTVSPSLSTAQPAQSEPAPATAKSAPQPAGPTSPGGVVGGNCDPKCQ